YCAGDQGLYWKFHTRLFQEQSRIHQALYRELSKELRLNDDRFENCRWGTDVAAALGRDRTEVTELGVTTVPAFIFARLVNGRAVIERVSNGTQGYEVFAKEIETLSRRR